MHIEPFFVNRLYYTNQYFTKSFTTKNFKAYSYIKFPQLQVTGSSK